ncbi:MAG: type II toxin-antitoxin system RelE/ParE family toxin [Gammaproteobacteria bacterium]|nr:type II toxin-antitoxin system RelE/ParE family toxin [Gammaproteobacteria bacterium]
MGSYELSKDAERDLREIAHYTLNRWGREMLRQYRDGLKVTFEAIASNDVPRRSFSKTLPELLVTKYGRHYIFYVTDSLPKPVIIGVIHESRDIVNRLDERLG